MIQPNLDPLSNEEAQTKTHSIDLAPIAAAKRIDALDILRGFALIGILMMNIEWFNRPISELGSTSSTLTGFDHAVSWLIRCFVEGKFYKLFALLFGMGFAVMLNSAITAGKPFGAWFVRRMLVLFVFGLLHLVFLWEGDILHDYAFAGLMLLPLIYLVRTKPLQKYNQAKTFLKIGLWWLLLPPIIGIFVGIGYSVSHDNQNLNEQWQESKYVRTLVDDLQAQAEQLAISPTIHSNADLVAQTLDEELANIQDDAVTQEDFITNNVEEETALSPEQEAQEMFDAEQENKQQVAKELFTLKEGDYWQVTQFRATKSLEHLMLTPLFTFSMLLPIFILGYWFISAGIMANYLQHKVFFANIRRVGLGVGLFSSVAGLMITDHPIAEHVGLLQIVGGFLFAIGQIFLAAGYLGLIMGLLMLPRWHHWLSHLAPLGRMALTNYLMHSLILSSLFYGYAGGLYGEVSRAPQMLIVAAIIGLQVIFSRWWLLHYRFGPLEWLWRSLTYKKWQTFKIQME